jgi:serine/threonine protein kinase
MFLNKQLGGNILFDDFALPDKDVSGINDINKLIKSKTDPDTGKLSFQTFDQESNIFTHIQLKSLRILINFVLPNMTFNDQKLSKEFITNVETMGAGSFGITIYYKDLIMKILHTDRGVGESDIIREIDILENLFRDEANPAPSTMNNYYGFMSGKNIGNLCRRNNFHNMDNKIKICSDLFKPVPPIMFANVNKGKHFSIDTQNIMENINQTLTRPERNARDARKNEYMKNNFLDDIVLLFFDKEDGDLDNYIKTIVPTLDNNTRVVMAKKLLTDIDSALNYMHKTKHVMHFDIKPQNIVYKMGEDGVPLFKLIDFGSTMPIHPVTGIARNYYTLTPPYFNNTRHSERNRQSYMYDRWCLLHCALYILGFQLSNGTTALILSQDAERISMRYGTDIHGGLNEFYEILNRLLTDSTRLILAPLKVPASNYGFFALIYNLLSNNNIPNGIPPL